MAGVHGDRPLVTGAAGFIGAALTGALVGRGCEVHAAVHPRTDAYRLAGLVDGLHVHRVDLADARALVPLVRRIDPTVVFHAAARHGHPSPAEAAAAWRDTVEATEALLGGLAGGTSLRRLVHLGSSLEYGPHGRPIRESDPQRPTTARGRTKLAATRAVHRWSAAQGLPAVVLRPFSVYGPGEPRGRLIPELLTCLAAGRPFRTTAGTYRRDLIHVDDVVEGCLRAATHPAAPGETFNLGTGREWSTGEVVAVAEAVTGRTATVVEGAFPARPPDTAHWVADTTHIQAVLGWRPSITLAEGLARTIAGRQTVAS